MHFRLFNHKYFPDVQKAFSTLSSLLKWKPRDILENPESTVRWSKSESGGPGLVWRWKSIWLYFENRYIPLFLVVACHQYPKSYWHCHLKTFNHYSLPYTGISSGRGPLCSHCPGLEVDLRLKNKWVYPSVFYTHLGEQEATFACFGLFGDLGTI